MTENERNGLGQDSPKHQNIRRHMEDMDSKDSKSKSNGWPYLTIHVPERSSCSLGCSHVVVASVTEMQRLAYMISLMTMAG